jgi:hypothetical protein
MFSMWSVRWLYNEFQMKPVSVQVVRASMKTFQFGSQSSLARSSFQQFQISSWQEIAKKEVHGGRRPQECEL